jgi:dUTPase
MTSSMLMYMLSAWSCLARCNPHSFVCIAQLILEEVSMVDDVEDQDLSDVERDEEGFGST